MQPSKPDSQIRILPLGPTEVGTGEDPALPSEADIRALVDAFYDAACRDDLLGPVFTTHVRDWSVHLPRIYDFWSSVVLRSGRYSGRPFETHAGLPGLSAAHFERWLALWEATVERVIAPDARDGFTASAERMAASMTSRLFGDTAP